MGYEKRYYIKWPMNYNYILKILDEKKKEKINFFIDFNSICKGFYKAETILYEISEYGETGEPSGKLISEFKDFLNNLYRIFKKFEPFFVSFYDAGACSQCREICKTYKSGRNISNHIPGEDPYMTDIFRKIRDYYYIRVVQEFTKDELSYVHYDKEYETDCVPYYCVQNDIFDSAQSEVLNIILSLDKDLLQTCKFPNTLQSVTTFKANKELGKYDLVMNLYDDKNAISYLYDKFQPGILTSKYIPMILALSGDKSDDILGLPGIGYAKAIKLIEKNNIPWTLDGLRKNIKTMPQIIQDNIDRVILNLKLIDFSEQIKRLPRSFMS